MKARHLVGAISLGAAMWYGAVALVLNWLAP